MHTRFLGYRIDGIDHVGYRIEGNDRFCYRKEEIIIFVIVWWETIK